MVERITFSVTNSDTLRVVDEYCEKQGISRSLAIATLLDATVPVLNDVNCYYQLADELNTRLLSGVYRQDLPRRKNVVDAERYCLEIFENNLLVGKMYDFDSASGILHVREKKRHYRRDDHIGKVESRYIKDICDVAMRVNSKDAQYACFIYAERIVFTDKKKSDDESAPIRLAAGDAFILMLKDVIYENLFFDLTGALFVNMIDLISSGTRGFSKTAKDPSVYCWVPILFSDKNAVIVPVHRTDSKKNGLTFRKPALITVITPI
ncbi:hypothetical protein [Pectobacterium parmentieri]|uniref:hypothetical protein n=1 Tax=Pectobacterium parmentieri TaxID=1905730 RepID=UPI0004743ACB|nr:hypothetical protein [Pectobacterium parmentieri]PWD68055.1 hypothetical protein DF211_00275 [Pectobacterium parmentieri]